MRKIVLYICLLYAAWLGLMLVHEFGHCLGAWVSGGRVAKVYFSPLDFSRTELAHNPRPLLTCWAGPIVGVIIPLLMLVSGLSIRNPKPAIRNQKNPHADKAPHGAIAKLLAFFAGFCLIINGVYLAAGSFFRGGDPADILRYGGSRWQLFLFAGLTIPTGFYLWHHLSAELQTQMNAE